MQESHIKKTEKIDFLSTFKAFGVGECEVLLFSDTHTHTSSLRTTYCKYRRMGLLTHKLRFTEVKNPAGTLIFRAE